MIVNNTPDGWQIIFQPAHGLLAAQLAMHFRSDLHACHWTETLVAIAQHDDFKMDFGSGRYLTSCGTPKDFTAVEFTDAERYEESRRRIAAAYEKHRWLGLLQSLHADRLHAGHDVDARLQQLLNDERKHRQRVLQQLDMDASELDYAYELLHWCDRCSLILSQNQLPAMQRRLEIISGLTDETYFIWQREDKSISIDPWPFADSSFEVAAEYRLLSQVKFKNEQQLAETIRSATIHQKHWKFVW